LIRFRFAFGSLCTVLLEGLRKPVRFWFDFGSFLIRFRADFGQVQMPNFPSGFRESRRADQVFLIVKERVDTRSVNEALAVSVHTTTAVFLRGSWNPFEADTGFRTAEVKLLLKCIQCQ
jgi:hypothetical protein